MMTLTIAAEDAQWLYDLLLGANGYSARDALVLSRVLTALEAEGCREGE